MEEDESEEYFGMFPSRVEYPPIIPEEIMECLAKTPAMIEECERAKRALDKALIVLQNAKAIIDESKI